MLDCLALLCDYSLVFAIQPRLNGAGPLVLRSFILPFCFAFRAHKTIISPHWSVIADPLIELVELFVPACMIIQRIVSAVEVVDRGTGRTNCVRPLILPIVLRRINLQVMVISVCLWILFETDLNLFLVALRVEIEYDLVHLFFTLLHVQEVLSIVYVLLLLVKVQLRAVSVLLDLPSTVVLFEAHAHLRNSRERALVSKHTQVLLIILSLPNL